MAALYGVDHPRAILANVERTDIAALDIADLDAFRQEAFVPANTTIVVTGRFDRDVVEAHVRRHFGRWQGVSRPTGPRNAVQPENAARAENLLIPAAEDRQVSVLIGFRAAGGYDHAHAARMVLAEMLTDRLSEVRERLAASYGVDAALTISGGQSLVLISGTIDPDQVGAATEVIRAQLERAGDLPGSRAAAFVRARKRVLEQLLSELSSAEGLAEQQQRCARHGLPTDYFEKLPDQIGALVLADLERIEQEILAGTRVVVMRGPEEAARQAMTGLGVSAYETLSD
jgi:zinc protease